MRSCRRIIAIVLAAYAAAAMAVCAESYTETLAYVRIGERADISHLAARDTADFTEEERQLIFQQTGLGKGALDSIEPRELLKYQEIFFTDIKVECVPSTPVSCEEYVPEPAARIVGVQDGDILYTSAAHISSWRNGHAAIVVDAEKGITLEAVVIGRNTSFSSLSKWEGYPNFRVLRLKGASVQERRSIAETAERCLADKPYDIFAGVFPVKTAFPENVRGTQCAHLVWQAYAAHGYDIDSDGGLIVTPRDISQSGLLETVQAYGQGVQ